MDDQPTRDRGLASDRDPAAERALGGGGLSPPERPRVAPTARAWGWAHENLFDRWYNTLLTLVFVAVLGWGSYRALRFVFVTARWEVIHRNLTNLMVFRWPERPDLVRPWLALFVGTAVVGFLLGRGLRAQLTVDHPDLDRPPLPSLGRSVVIGVRRLWPMLFLLVVIWSLSRSPVTAALLVALTIVTFATRELGLRPPDHLGRRLTLPVGLIGLLAAFGSLVWFGGHGWSMWGGPLLTLFVAAGGIVLSFPFGVALALGRRSSFPVVRVVSTTYIEVIRGVPLITLLLMGNLMLGFFLPDYLADVSRVTRALVAVILFTAAYVAEIVRGGLQSVPQGQVEAAQAIGLSTTKVMRLVVLPQALRNVIPALVGQFISLFKDTSLLAIITLFELFGVSQLITSQGDFAGQGLLAEILVFVSVVYWVFTYTMSRESQRLERQLGVGER